MTALSFTSFLVVTLLAVAASRSSGSSPDEERPIRFLTDVRRPFKPLGRRHMLQINTAAGAGAGAKAGANVADAKMGTLEPPDQEDSTGEQAAAGPLTRTGTTGSSEPEAGAGADGEQKSSDSSAEAGNREEGLDTTPDEAHLGAPDSGDSRNQAAASIALSDNLRSSPSSGDNNNLKSPYRVQRQPEAFQGVTLDEYNVLRAKGEIDAYGFSTNEPPLRAAAGPASSADAPQPAAAKQRKAGEVISLSSGYVDPLG